MDNIEFGKMCRPFLKEYFSMFGESPSPSDYVCTNNEFLENIKKAVDNKVKIGNYLTEKNLIGDIKGI